MHRWFIPLLLAFLLVGGAFGAEKVIPHNAKIYIEKMDEGLDGYIRAEFVKKSVPLQIVTQEEDADLIMTGNAANQKRSWHEGWLSARSRSRNRERNDRRAFDREVPVGFRSRRPQPLVGSVETAGALGKSPIEL